MIRVRSRGIEADNRLVLSWNLRTPTHLWSCRPSPASEMTDEDENPIERLYEDDESERPDTVNIDGVAIDAQEFLARLESLADAADAVTTLTRDLEHLRETGLSDDDARDLIYGRNSRLTKRDIEAMFDAVDTLSSGRADRPLERLLSEVSGLNLSETEEVMDELTRLHERYGGDRD